MKLGEGGEGQEKCSRHEKRSMNMREFKIGRCSGGSSYRRLTRGRIAYLPN